MYIFIGLGTIKIYSFDATANEIKERGVLAHDSTKYGISCLYYFSEILYAGLYNGTITMWNMSVPKNTLSFLGVLQIQNYPEKDPRSTIVGITVSSSMLICAQYGGAIDAYNIEASYNSCGTQFEKEVKLLIKNISLIADNVYSCLQRCNE